MLWVLLLLAGACTFAGPGAHAATLTEQVPLALDRSDRAYSDAEWDELERAIRLNATTNATAEMSGPQSRALFTDPAAAPDDWCGYAVALGDVNGDGLIDAMLGCRGSSSFAGKAVVFTKDASGPGFTYDSTLTEAIPTGSHFCGEAVALRDIDADGRADAFVSCSGAGTGGSTLVFTRDAGGGFTLESTLVRPSGSTSDRCGISLAVDDVTADGRPDVLIGCSGASNRGDAILFTKNAGAGFTYDSTIVDPAPNTLDSCGSSVALGDVNSDGRLDALMGCSGDSSSAGNGIVFTKNAGAGFTYEATIAAPVPTSGDNCGASVALGDVNSDGRADAALGCNIYGFDNRSHVFTKNAGTGFTYDSVLTDTTSINVSCGLAIGIADANADGRGDVYVGCYGYTGSVAVYTRNAGAGFTLSNTVSPGGGKGCGRFATADVNGDGRYDVLQGCYATAALRGGAELASVGPTTTLTNPSPVPYDYCGSSVAVGDISGDGRADAVIGCTGMGSNAGGVLAFVKNAGAGFTYESTFAGAGSYACGSSVAVGDVNGDGLGDVLMGCSGASARLLRKNAGPGSGFVEETTIGTCSTSVALHDMNGDGRPDALLGCASSNGSTGDATLYIRNRSSGFTLDTTITDPSAAFNDQCGTSLAVGDINADGRSDVLIGCPGDTSSAGNALAFTKNVGMGFSFDSSITGPAAAPNDDCGRSVALGDVNGDGRADAVIGCADTHAHNGSAITFTKDVGSGFTYDSTLTDPLPNDQRSESCGTSVAMGDVNADGRADVVVGCPERSYLMIGGALVFSKNTGAGYTLDTAMYDASPATFEQCGTAVATGDVTADGRADVLSGCSFDNTGTGRSAFVSESLTSSSFPVSGTVQTTRLNQYGGTVLGATITTGSALNGGGVALQASADGGSTWEAVTSGAAHSFAATGTDLRLRLTLTSDAGRTATPYVHGIQISYTTLNHDPSTPSLVSPSDNATTDDTRLAATFNDSDSVDTGAIEFEVCTVAMGTGQTCAAAGGTTLASGSSPSGVEIGADGEWTINPTLVTPQTVHWRARAHDDWGGTSAWSGSRELHLLPPATVKGVVTDTTLCDGLTPVVGIAVNSSKWSTVPCAAGTGVFATQAAFAAGDVLTAYYDDVAMEGAAYVRTLDGSSTAAITDLVLIDGAISVESRDPSTPITEADIDRWDGDDDADITAQYPVGSRLDIGAGATLVVRAGTFAPTSTVRAPKLFVLPDGTYDAGATRLDLMAGGTGDCTGIGAQRPLCSLGTFAPGTGVTSYRSNDANVVTGGTYHDLEIVSGGTATVDLGTLDTPLIQAESMSITGTGGAPVASTSAADPQLMITNDLTVDGTATLSGSGTMPIIVGGDALGSGDVDLPTNLFAMAPSPLNGNTQFNPTGGSATPWRFGTLYFYNINPGSNSVTVPATSRGIDVTGAFAAASVADPFTADAAAAGQALRVGSFMSMGPTTFEAPPDMIVDGDFQNDADFVASGGTVTFIGTARSNITSSTPLAFHELAITSSAAPAKVVALNNAITIGHALTMTGATCGTAATLAAADPSMSHQTVHNASATLNTSIAMFEGIDFTTPTTAHDAHGQDNTNLDFDGAPCRPVGELHVDGTDASSGAQQPNDIDGRTSFHMSFRNDETDVDSVAYTTEVSSSVLDDSVKALFPLDGDGDDRASTANPATAHGGVTWTSHAPEFGQAASFDGIDDYLEAPSDPAYDATTFTVDFWMRAPGWGPDTYPKLVERQSGGNVHFAVGLNRDNGQLVGWVTSDGGTGHHVTAPAAPILDDTWHHIAFSVDASKALHLYVDGVDVGYPVSYTGTLDMPSAPISIGGLGYSTNYYQGMIDDVQFTAGDRDGAAIAGYVATQLPHAHSIWRSNPSGTSFGSPCAPGARCEDVVYGGPDIHRDGARYHVTHQALTAHGLWSEPASDWFETSDADAITISAPGAVALPSIIPMDDSTTSFPVTTTCGASLGCDLQFSSMSDTAAMATTGASDFIPPITPAAPAAPGAWPAGDPRGLGVTVLSSSGGKDVGRWGAGADFSDLDALRFVGPTRTPTLLQHLGTGTSETTSVGLRANVPLAQAAGAYRGYAFVVALPGV